MHDVMVLALIFGAFCFLLAILGAIADAISGAPDRYDARRRNRR